MSGTPVTAEELRQAISDLQAAAAGRTFTQQEKNEWNAYNAALDEIETRRARILELAHGGSARHIEAGGHRPADDRVTHRPRRRTDVLPQLQEDRSRALHAIDRISGEMSARAADTMAAVIDEDVAGPERGATSRYISACGDPSYRSAFGKWLSDPLGAHMKFTPNEHSAWGSVNAIVAEQRALGIGSQGGGYPVPIALDPTVLLTSDGVLNPIRQIARVTQITGNTWEGVASTGTSATYAAEFTEASDNSPTLTQPTATVVKAQAFIPFSIEAGQDWNGLQVEMAAMLADAKDVLEADKFLRGSGVNEPQGLHTAATAVYTSAASATFGLADLYGLDQALPARWVPRASIIGNKAALNKIRQFDTTGVPRSGCSLVTAHRRACSTTPRSSTAP